MCVALCFYSNTALSTIPFCLPPSQPGSSIHLALVREAADFKLKYGRKKEAISDLEQLWKWVMLLTIVLFLLLFCSGDAGVCPACSTCGIQCNNSSIPLLHRQNTNDIHTLAQLISAYSLVDQDKAKSYPFFPSLYLKLHINNNFIWNECLQLIQQSMPLPLS